MRIIPSGRGLAVPSQMLTVVKDGLVCNVDAGDTNSYPGTGVTWSDRSTAATNFTLTNGPTYNTNPFAGLTAANISFDGVDDHALNAANTAQQALSNQSDFSIDVWFRFTSPASAVRCIVSNGTTTAGSANRGIGLALSVVNGGNTTVRMTITTDTSINIVAAYNEPTSNLTAASFVHLVGTYDYDDGTGFSAYTFYKNNSLAASGQVTQPTSMGNSSNPMYIARRPSGTLQYAPIQLVSLKVYNKILSTTEVAQNYNALRGRFGL